MLKDVELNCDVMICPPATLIGRLQSVVKGTHIGLGGQDLPLGAKRRIPATSLLKCS